MRAMRSGDLSSAPAESDHVEVEVRLADVFSQGGLVYPVESVAVERA